MDSSRVFNGMAAVYTAGRPAYAGAFIEDLYCRYGFSADSVIADVGSGTGKFARQLLEKGSFVYCVEPNRDMRRQAETELQAYERCRCVSGDASHTTLTEKSVDFVTAAQAFHWFDGQQFKRECGRILRPGGGVFLIWNARNEDSEFVRKNREICREFCPAFKGFGGGTEKDDQRIREFFDGIYERREYDHPLRYNRETFISRNLSSSYALKPGEPGYGAFVERLEALFEEYARDGVVVMPNKTAVYAGAVC